MECSFFDIRKEELEGFYPILPDEFIKNDGLKYLGAIDTNGYACGIIVWHVNAGHIEIDHIAVSPDLTKQGIGRGLVDALMQKIENIYTFSPVVAVYEDIDENKEFDVFIRKIPYFTTIESGRFHIISAKARNNSKSYQSFKEMSFKVDRFLNISPLEKKFFYRNLENHGMHMFKKHDEKDLISKLSLCRVSGDEVVAAVLVSKNSKDELYVSFVYSKEGREKDLGACLCEVIKAADKYYPDCPICFNAENEQSINLSKRLFGDGIVDVPVYTAVSFGREI